MIAPRMFPEVESAPEPVLLSECCMARAVPATHWRTFAYGEPERVATGYRCAECKGWATPVAMEAQS